jgi:hypothetical protein
MSDADTHPPPAHPPGYGMPAPVGRAPRRAPGERRTILGKIAFALAVVPYLTFVLLALLQPG